jgi:pSer/pThr/pTyr-binding forkhead associated (FHA) protein
MKTGEAGMLKSNTNTTGYEYKDEKNPIAQVFVFKDKTCLGWDCFHKHSIQIGSSSDADIVLNDPSIDGRHAVIYIKGGKIVVSAKTHGTNFLVNSKQVTSAILGPLDVVGLGPFTLKVKIPPRKNRRPPIHKEPKKVQRLSTHARVIEKWKKRPQEITHVPPSKKAGTYRVIFKGDLLEGYTREAVETNLCSLLPSDPEVVTSYLEKRRTLVTHNISMAAAKKYHLAFERAGARCTIEAVSPDLENRTTSVEKTPMGSPSVKEATLEFEDRKDNNKNSVSKDNILKSKRVPTPQQNQPLHLDEEEDQEEEEDIRPFLKKGLLESVNLQTTEPSKASVLEIIKFKGDTIIDLQYLAPKDKYIVEKNGKRFCLAKSTAKDIYHLFFGDNQTGFIKNTGAPDQLLSELCTHEYLHQKKKRIFSTTLSAGQTCHLEEGGYHYHLRLVPKQDSPEVSIPKTQQVPFYKSVLKSSGLHVFLMVFISLFLSLPEMPGPKEPESHFVKIDMRQFQKPQPVKTEPPSPPKVVRPRETKKPVELKKTLPAPKKSKPKTAQKAKPASSPKAGGGSGKSGNVKTRNVKETGILGLIGDGIGLTPNEALASVTNMDIVSSPGATDKNFKIGGIAGKIPGSKVEIVTGDVVRSKGTQQVLRSAGIEGKGDVAALRKGKTGQNKVMAMVSVDLDKSVRVQGGMSREEVKRIIDEHLDEISFCYENALMDAPSLMGNIVFEWKILMSGNVGAVRIKSSTVRSSQIHNCIQAAIKSWQFPQPQNAEVMVSYPFVFDIVGF